MPGSSLGRLQRRLLHANTSPVNDSQSITRLILKESDRVGLTRVYPIACISKGLAGKSLCDFEALKQAGAIAETAPHYFLLTLGRNIPIDGWQLTGKPVLTIVEGRIVFDDGRC